HDIHEKREPFLYLYFLFPTGRYRVFLFEFACFSKHVLFVILVDHAALFLGQSHLQNCPSRLKPLSIDRLLFFYFHLPAFLSFYLCFYYYFLFFFFFSLLVLFLHHSYFYFCLSLLISLFFFLFFFFYFHFLFFFFFYFFVIKTLFFSLFYLISHQYTYFWF